MACVHGQDVACLQCGCRECGNLDGRYGCRPGRCGAATVVAADVGPTKLDRANQRIGYLESALQFYATASDAQWMADSGARARAALAAR